MLVLLQWIGGQIHVATPLKTVGSFVLVVSGMRLLPWTEALVRLRPDSTMGGLVLTAFFARHFVIVLGEEAGRLLVAHRMAAPCRYGPGWFRSLSWALAGLFQRSLERAERFYAAQMVRGLGG
jgi:energy-coupling factor transporter transmembrane protein EcfT